MPPLNPVQCDKLARHNALINHGFFTREGGASSGIYHGLNVGLGSNDSRSSINENRDRVAKHFDTNSANLATPHQIHSAKAITIDTPMDGERPQVDGIATATPNLVIGILTADCGPVIFCDAKNRVIGACHAGWQGATGGVMENTIKKMESLGADRSQIEATLGPTISQKNYEVGPEFVERLLGFSNDNQKYLIASPKAGHQMFDLPNYIIDKLTAADTNAHWTGHCTYADENRFFSYRRTTHNNEPDYGRQISAISLRA